MLTATGDAQTIAVFGGTSELGLAIVTKLITPSTRHIVLACRNTNAAAKVALDPPNGCEMHIVHWDATEIETHPGVVARIANLVGDIDIAIIAAGVLGAQEAHDVDPTSAGNLVIANTAGPITTCSAVAGVMRHQRHGHLVVLASVAGIRARATNHVYGASKAGLDAYARGLTDHLAGTGVHVTIVRPGFVQGRMTAGQPAPPFATTPDRVAADTVRAIRSQRRTVYSPRTLRWLFLLLRHLPINLWRRLP